MTVRYPLHFGERPANPCYGLRSSGVALALVKLTPRTFPNPGSIMWSDMLAIPKDALHTESAYAFINYTMAPKVSANLSNFMRFASANEEALPLINADVRNNPGIFPPPELRSRLAVRMSDTPEQTRAIVRMWQRFKTAQ